MSIITELKSPCYIAGDRIEGQDKFTRTQMAEPNAHIDIIEWDCGCQESHGFNDCNGKMEVIERSYCEE